MDSDLTRCGSEYVDLSEDEIEKDETDYTFNWINFNLKCVKVDFGIDLFQEEFYKDDSNVFFNSDIFSCFREDDVRVDIEEGMEKCPKCYSFKVLIEQVQKRSADEGMTNIFICSECKCKWEN
jgi:DNA-directed RNA polymerase subunit M/transcription elongation factor TFIIS